jgi:tousled-like kinase
VCLDEV